MTQCAARRHTGYDMQNKAWLDELDLTGRFISIKRADIRALVYIQRHMRTRPLDVAMRFFTRLGNGGTIWLCAAALMWLVPGWRDCAISIATVLVVGLLTGNLIIKRLSSRMRPYDFLDRKPLVKPLKDYSFPSCHAMSSFACATMICYFSRPLGFVAVGIAALIAFSRLYLFVHYPTDVVLGSLWGVIIALTTHWFLATYLFRTYIVL